MIMVRIPSKKKLLALVVLFFGQIVISLSEHTFSEDDERGALNSSISERLHNEVSSFEAIKPSESEVNKFLDKWDIAGASVAIAKDEQLIYAKGFGYTDTTNKEVVQPRHLFRIASISKLITAVAIMKLEEQEKLKLTDTVFGKNGILNDPKFRDIRDSRVKDITVKHLLTHSAGWSRYSGDPVFMPYTIKSTMDTELPVDLETTIQYTLKKRALDFAPGTSDSYSNFGYALLGKVVEKITNMEYEQFVISEILNPIGIYDMHIGHSKLSEKYSNEVKYYANSRYKRSYSSFREGKIVPRQYGGNNFDVLGAAGAWIASPAELLKLVVHIDGQPGKKDILSKQTIEKMVNMENKNNPIGWVSTTTDGTWKRTGTLTGTSALLKRQKNGFTYVILLNTSNDKGPEFTNDLDTLMTTVLAGVNQWPDYDLFYYSKPKSIYSYSQPSE
jgi:CubicO group peptidase (beta-lactamase class C family)